MAYSKLKRRAGKAALALGLGAALAWAVLVGGPAGSHSVAGGSNPQTIVVADGGANNPPPGSG